MFDFFLSCYHSIFDIPRNMTMIALLVLSALAITQKAECGRLKKEVNGLSSSYFPGYSYTEPRNVFAQNSQGAVQQSQRRPSSVPNSVQTAGIAANNIGVSVSHSILGVPYAFLSDSGALVADSGAQLWAGQGAQLMQGSRAPSSAEDGPQLFTLANKYNDGFNSFASLDSINNFKNTIRNELSLDDDNKTPLLAGNTNTYSQRTRLFPVRVARPIQVVRNNPVPITEEVPEQENRPVQLDIPQPVNIILSRPYSIAARNPAPITERIPVYAGVQRPVPVNVPRTFPVLKQVNVSVSVPHTIGVRIPLGYQNVNNQEGSSYSGSLRSSAGLGRSLSKSVASFNGLSSSSTLGGSSWVEPGSIKSGLNDNLYSGDGSNSGSGSSQLYGGSFIGRGSYRGIGSYSNHFH